MKKVFYLIFLFSVVRGVAQESGGSFTLKEAQEYALENGYSILDKELEYEKAIKTISETRAQGLPQLNASLDYQYNPQIMQQPIPAQFLDPEAPEGAFITLPFGVAHQNTANLTYNQLIFDASYFVGLQAARVVKEAARLDVERAEIDIKTDVAQSYYGVLVSRETIRLLKENLGSLQSSFEETKKLYESGFVEEQDADQLELLVNNLSNNLNNAQRQEELAMQLLKFNMGVPLDSQITLSDDIEDVMIVDEAEVLINQDFNYEDHIAYRALQAQKRGSELQVRNQKSGYLPKINGFVRHTESNFGQDFKDVFYYNGWIPSTAIGVGLSWNLFEGLRRSATVQKAKLDLERAEVSEELTRNQLELQFNQAVSDYKFALDNYNNQMRNVEVSKKIRDKTRIKFQEGLSSSLDLSQAENQFLETQRNYVQALQNLLNSKENLEKAIGK